MNVARVRGARRGAGALWFGWLLAAVLCAVANASAQTPTALLLPATGDDGLRAERKAAHAAVQAALQEQGFVVTRVAQAKDGTHCTQLSCAAAMLAALNAQLAVAVALWKADAGIQLHVTLVDEAGARYRADAPLQGGDAGDAARVALLEARSLHLLGPGPWVVVEGEPDGALVYIDGARVGPMPYRGPLSPGDHVVQVHADGYSTDERPVQVPLDPTTTVRIAVALTPGEGMPIGRAPAPGAGGDAALVGSAGMADRPGDAAGLADTGASGYTDAIDGPVEVTDEASPWNYVLGGALVVGGVALATIDPLRAAIRDGDCVDGDCTRVYRFGGDSMLKVAVGVAVVGAGVTLMIWQPLRVRVEAGQSHLGLTLRGQI